MTTCTAVLIDRKNGTQLDLSLSKAIPAAAVSTSCASLTEQSQHPRIQKTAVFHSALACIHSLLQSHLLFHSGLSSEFAMVQGSVVPTTNPEA